jgi:hypothetical protein
VSLVQYDRVQETSTTTGTGTYTLAGAVLGYQSFAVVGNANTCYYCAMGVDGNGNPNGDGWEVGLGTYTAAGTTLARTAVLASTNANAAVNWAAGTRRIFVTLAAGGALPFLLANATGLPFTTGLTNISAAYVNLQDQKAQNTAGGTFTAGAWQTRVLNTEVSDVGGLCSLASNQFTLAAGTYTIHASAPAYLVNARHQLRLQNVTDTTTLLVGNSNYAPTITANVVQTNALLRGIFTIAAGKALELQHQCQATEAADGFGVPSNFTTEVYAVVELWKVG